MADRKEREKDRRAADGTEPSRARKGSRRPSVGGRLLTYEHHSWWSTKTHVGRRAPEWASPKEQKRRRALVGELIEDVLFGWFTAWWCRR